MTYNIWVELGCLHWCFHFEGKENLLPRYRFFSCPYRLVSYINNSQQQHQEKKIRWSSSSVSSVPFFFLTLCQAGSNFFLVFFLFSFSSFIAFLQFCSRQSLAVWQFYCSPLLRITTRWNHCLKVGSQWDMACMLMTAWWDGGGGRCANVSYTTGSFLWAVGGLHLITSLYIQETAKSQIVFILFKYLFIFYAQGWSCI